MGKKEKAAVKTEQAEQIAEGSYKVYGYRWVVLIVFLLISIMIQVLWATFFSISAASAEYYGFTDAAKGESAISLLSIIFMAGMIVLSVPSMAAFEKWGFKKSVSFGAVLMGVCGILRGVFGTSYTALVIVTVGFAIAQPFILNAPGLVAGKWFPEKERATANSCGLLANYVGISIGLLVSPYMLNHGMDVKQMLWVYGIAAAVTALLFVVFAREKPPTPPCSYEESVRVDFKQGFRTAWKRRNFLACVIIFFIMLGVFNTFFTLIESILADMTDGVVGSSESGVVGVVVLLTGVVGSLVISMISDKDKRHRRLIYVIIANIIGTVGFVLFMVLGTYIGMIIAAVIYGIFTIGSAPVLLTMAAEEAYPTSEGTSEGLMMWMGNIGGVIFLGIASLMGNNHMGLMILMAVLSALCVVRMFFMKETKLIKTDGTK